MLDKLLDLLVEWVKFFVFFYVVDEYERGVVLRFGRFLKEVEPGFHWCLPFNIDVAHLDNVVPRTHVLGAQSLVTMDGKIIVVAGVVTAAIRDIKKAVLEVEGVDHALIDSCLAAIGSMVSSSTWDDLASEAFSESLTKACRKQAWRYGIEIQRVQLSDLSPCRAIRLHTSAVPT